MTISSVNWKSYQFLPRFYRLSLVSMLSNMMVPLAGLVDTAFLGHLDDIKHLAGVILASILFDYLYRILKFLRSSTNAITAAAKGLEDEKAILVAGLQSALIALIIGLLILSLQYPLQKVGFALLGGTVDVETSGAEYFYGRIWGAPAVLLNFVLFGWFLGLEMNGIVLLVSLIGNLSNVFLDYLMIVKWGWASYGAGLATSLSQYLALVVALICAAFRIDWSLFGQAFAQILKKGSFKDTLALKANILIRFIVLISTYALFTNVSSLFGTTTLAQNGVMLQIALLSQFTVNGIGLTTQTLASNFNSKGIKEQLLPLLIASLVTSLVISLLIALACFLFPDQIFGLLTDHEEINENITLVSFWLLPLLGSTSFAFMLDGYFTGLKEGKVLRNAVLVAFFLGYLPFLGIALYLHNNNWLWLSLVSYMVTVALYLGMRVPKTLQ